MLMIRLQRVGRTNDASFRIVVTEKERAAKTGGFLEVVGSYDPRRDSRSVKADRVTYWISKGAQVSPTLHNLLVSEKIISGKKVNVLPKKKPIAKEGATAPASAAAPVAAPEAASAPEVVAEEAPAETVAEEASTEATPEAPLEETPQA